MNIAALKWAGRQATRRPTGKLVLLAYAHHANPKGVAWPSLAALVEFTGLNRKTIIREVKSLAYAGLMEDSGERRGTTAQIKVWRLATAQESLSLSGKSPRTGTIKSAAKSPPYGDSLFADADAKESLNRNSSVQARKSPLIGTRKDIEGSRLDTDVSNHAGARGKFESPAGVPDSVWSDFLKSPKRRKAGMSPTAYAGICNNLTKLAEHGFPPGDMIALAVENGWTTVKLDWVQNDHRNTKGNRQSPDGLSSTGRAALAVFGPD